MSKRGVETPCDAYVEYLPKWRKCRDVFEGGDAINKHDAVVNMNCYLLPFSPGMDPAQYNFYKREAEYPGIVGEYARMLIGGLIRKRPQISFPSNISSVSVDWIYNSFMHEGSGLVTFLAQALREELITSSTWVYVDLPEDPESNDVRPFAVIWPAESVINWRYGIGTDGTPVLTQVIHRITGTKQDPDDEFHELKHELIRAHVLIDGKYVIRTFSRCESDKKNKNEYVEGDVIIPLLRGEPLTRIPAWPLNGRVTMETPLLSALADRELQLYNKISRRNHLLYCASTYTIVVSSNMDDTAFRNIVSNGLGSWILVPQDDKVSVLDTPVQAITSLETAIKGSVEIMAKMGIRMLAPENSQSGVALDIRSAGQVARLSSMNTQIGGTLSDVIAFMLSCNLNTRILPSTVQVKLSADFDPTPLGAEWLRLVTEWYEKQLLPRSTWLETLKTNDIITADYDDTAGQAEINAGTLLGNR